MRKAKKATEKTTEVCGASASGGQLVCVLAPGHDGAHSTARPRSKPLQHATWLLDEDGRVKVTAYSKRVAMSSWYEEPDGSLAPPRCGEPEVDEAVLDAEEDDARCDGVYVDARCELNRGHYGDHFGRLGPNAHVWARPDGSAISMIGGGWKDSWRRCGDHSPKGTWRCDRPEEHDGKHIGAAPGLDEVETWSGKKQQKVSTAGISMATYVKLGRPEEPGLTDSCGKCGRELGEHDGKKCPPKRKQGRVADVEARAAALEEPTEAADRDLKPANMIAPTGETIECGGKVYRVHPAARLFPTPQEQYERIRDSIRDYGQKDDIELLPDDSIIDGCTRLRACAELGIEPRFATERITADPIRHVIAKNLDRRHLDESQRSMAAADLASLEHGANQHTRGAANLPVLTQAQAAELLHVSERSVRDAVRVRNLAVPEVVEAVRSGRVKVSAAAELTKLEPNKQREIVEKVTKGKGEVRAGKVRALVKQETKREVVRKINEGKVQTIGMLSSGFGVALSDPAWPYDNSDQHNGSRGHIPYPGQPVEEIVRLHTIDLPARMADDALLFLCVTNAFVPVATKIAETGVWTWRTMVTITKARTGLGTWARGRTEHVVILSRGEPTHTLNEISTWLGDRAIDMPSEHSRKPEELYEVIEQHCGGPRLELYSRYPRDGWSAWGAEADGKGAA